MLQGWTKVINRKIDRRNAAVDLLLIAANHDLMIQQFYDEFFSKYYQERPAILNAHFVFQVFNNR